MAISVIDDFDSYECLKRKMVKIEHNSNCKFVIDKLRIWIEMVNDAYRHVVCFDYETKNYLVRDCILFIDLCALL